MLTQIIAQASEQIPAPKEGDLYKEITIANKTFRLLYGYYENFERNSQFNEPMPIYPDLIKEPHFTDKGIPIVTAMQNICEYYNDQNDVDSSCADCSYFQRCEELFGLCNCPQKQIRQKL